MARKLVGLSAIKVLSIEKLKDKHNVYDLSVEGNHNFYITAGNILTHNCDFLTFPAQAALRHVLEGYMQHTRFILTANYKDRIIPALFSRTQSFELVPPSKAEVAVRLAEILDAENVKYSDNDIAYVVNACFPDIRKCINELQKYNIDGKIILNTNQLIESDYKLSILEILKDKKKGRNNKIADIRKLIADNKVREFTGVYRLLYDKIDEISNKDNYADILITIAEGDYEGQFNVDKEINFISCVCKLTEKI